MQMLTLFSIQVKKAKGSGSDTNKREENKREKGWIVWGDIGAGTSEGKWITGTRKIERWQQQKIRE